LYHFLAILLGLYAAVALYLGRRPHDPDVTAAMLLASMTMAVRRAIRSRRSSEAP
jgi:hypothetical protein